MQPVALKYNLQQSIHVIHTSDCTQDQNPIFPEKVHKLASEAKNLYMARYLWLGKLSTHDQFFNSVPSFVILPPTSSSLFHL